MPRLEDIEALQNSFAAADSDANGRLSFDEAVAVVPSLSAAQFNALDADNDRELTLEELQAWLDANRPVPSDCFQSMAYVEAGFRKILGDLLLLALGGLAALRWRAGV